jgi:hypothetical protein
LHRGRKLTLPLGGDPLPYLRAAAKLDPQPSRLQKLIDQLEGAPAGAGATPHPAGVPWNRATQLARGPMQPSFASKLTGLVFALGSADTLTAQSSPVERELLRLEDNWCLAPRTRDETLLNGILAEDHVEVTGSGRITSRAEAIASLKDPKSPTTWCANSNVKARVYGVPFSGKRLVFTDTSGRQTATWS